MPSQQQGVASFNKAKTGKTRSHLYSVSLRSFVSGRLNKWSSRPYYLIDIDICVFSSTSSKLVQTKNIILRNLNSEFSKVYGFFFKYRKDDFKGIKCGLYSVNEPSSATLYTPATIARYI